MIKLKAVALYSGGLDSTLSIILMAKCGVDVEAVNFSTDLIPDKDTMPFKARLQRDADRFGFRYTTVHLGREFIDMVRSPLHGYGKNMNPCIDCKIMMLKKAGELMSQSGADFVITGEVVGQRPMSQMKQTIRMIEKASGLEGMIVRPLSGKILDPTSPEQNGLIKRDWLLDINGRSRKVQMRLADQFGLKDYASPAGGCLLTDPNYSSRLRDLFENQDQFDTSDIFLLRHGRHFRLSKNARLIVGRDKADNENIQGLAGTDHYLIEVKDTGSPIGLLAGKPGDDDIKLAAAIVAGYSDARSKDPVTVDIDRAGENVKIEIAPAGREISSKYIL
jgi:tRNA-specific 2-thiouridylase